MAIFATIAIVCAFSFATDKVECDDYVIDHAYTQAEGFTNTEAKDKEFYLLWGDEGDLNAWLARYNIKQTPATIESVEFETKTFTEDMIP